jgi:hypothetical protein
MAMKKKLISHKKKEVLLMKLVILSALIALFSLSGCKSTPPMYEYNNYAESYYSLKKSTSDESYKEWKISLEAIIELSNEKSMRVPPGVYANLGYIHLKANNQEQAIQYFEQEKGIYPESEKFMNSLIKKTKS